MPTDSSVAIARWRLGTGARAVCFDAGITSARGAGVFRHWSRDMTSKITKLTQALVGRFRQHHAFLCRMHLDRLDVLEVNIAELYTRMQQALEPFRDTLARLDTIPGVGQDVAEVIIAETGADMSHFPIPGHLASWAGVAPGLNQSGQRHKPAHTRHGDHWLTGALGVAAMAANRTQDTTFLGARYRRLARRIGKLKALWSLSNTPPSQRSGMAQPRLPPLRLSVVLVFDGHLALTAIDPTAGSLDDTCTFGHVPKLLPALYRKQANGCSLCVKRAVGVIAVH
jgi:hypothetical protein